MKLVTIPTGRPIWFLNNSDSHKYFQKDELGIYREIVSAGRQADLLREIVSFSESLWSKIPKTMCSSPYKSLLNESNRLESPLIEENFSNNELISETFQYTLKHLDPIARVVYDS